MNKAPDTRGKLDSQKGLNERKKPVLKLKKDLVTKKTNRVTFGDLQKATEPSPLKLSKEKKPTKGQLFKAQYGYSKSTKRNLKKNYLDINAFSDAMNALRLIRKNRRVVATKLRQAKHAASVLYKRSKGKTKDSKGKAPASKKVEVKVAA